MNTEDRTDLHEKIEKCTAIAWDTCHKIYILMDQQQLEKMKGYGYEAIIKAEHSTPRLMYSTVLNWYKNSCSLKLIDAISTNEDGASDVWRVVAQS